MAGSHYSRVFQRWTGVYLKANSVGSDLYLDRDWLWLLDLDTVGTEKRRVYMGTVIRLRQP